MLAKVGTGRTNGWRILGWGTLAALLLVPAAAMQVTDEVNWDETDFIVMGVMLGSVGLGLEYLFRKSGSLTYRLGTTAAVLASFLTIWVNLAVGMIGSEDRLYNLLFLGVIVLAWTGAAAARFRPMGMARAMFLAAVAQALLATGGLSTDLRGGIFSLFFALPWLVAAALFARGGREQGAA